MDEEQILLELQKRNVNVNSFVELVKFNTMLFLFILL